MPELATMLPCRRPDLVVSSLGDDGPYVVKYPASGNYFHFGEQAEHFGLAWNRERPRHHLLACTRSHSHTCEINELSRTVVPAIRYSGPAACAEAGMREAL